MGQPARKPSGEQLSGTLLEVLYHNADTEFACIEVLLEGERLVRATGTLSNPVPGERITLEGEWTRHHARARVFDFSRANTRPPEGVVSQVDYLIRATDCPRELAEGLIRHFGENAIALLETDPARLVEAPGVDEQTAADLHERWLQTKTSDRLSQAIKDVGLDPALIGQVRRFLGESSDPANQLRSNPYLLSIFFEHVPFRRADAIAHHLRVQNQDDRIAAAIMYCLRIAAMRGNTYVAREELPRQLTSLLSQRIGEGDQTLQRALRSLGERDLVISTEERVALADHYRQEADLALALSRLQRGERDFDTAVPVDRLKRILQHKAGGRTPAPLLLSGVQQTLLHKVVLVDAPGPVTAARFIDAAAHVFGVLCADIVLCSPVLESCRRLVEATGIEATTPELLVGARPHGPARYRRDNPLECDLCIVTDAHLMPLPDMARLIDALPDRAAVVILGDRHSVLPAGPGRPFLDLLAAGIAPVLELPIATNDGQPALSAIRRAIRDRAGVELPDAPSRRSPVWAIPSTNTQIDSTLTILYRDVLPLTGVDTRNDVLCLAIRPRDELRDLNELLQQLLNGTSQEVLLPGRTLRSGDVLYNVHPLPEHGLMRGCSFTLQRLQSGPTLVLAQGDTAYPVGGESLQSLALGYARLPHTHPSRTYHTVVLACGEPYADHLRGNQLYHAASLARERLVLVGAVDAFRRAAEVAPEGRATGLRQALTAHFRLEGGK